MLKSVFCAQNADQSHDAATQSAWRRLAADWRDMARDADASATTARLMDRMRAAHGDALP